MIPQVQPDICQRVPLSKLGSVLCLEAILIVVTVRYTVMCIPTRKLFGRVCTLAKNGFSNLGMHLSELQAVQLQGGE